LQRPKPRGAHLATPVPNPASPAAGLRASLHRQLAPEAWPGPGLSPLNRLVCGMIVVGGAFAILETEPEVLAAAPAGLFVFVEAFFALLFLAEYLTRVWVAGEDPRYAGGLGRLRYARTPMAVVDLLAVAPYSLLAGTTDAFLLRVARLLRILRLARLGRFSQALRLFGVAVRSRRYELGLSAGLAMLILIFSSTLMYALEGESQPDAFGSIPRALWWSVATLTTVGYGDVYPVTVGGKLLAGVTAISAIGLIALPAGILAAAFSDAFRRQRAPGAGEPRD
jgi:voltage-gated potassium channel